MPTFLLQEKCYEVPREECRDITEQIPVKVCTQIDRTREPKATLVSRPYGRWVTCLYFGRKSYSCHIYLFAG